MSKNFRCPKGRGLIPCLCSISVAAGSLSCGIPAPAFRPCFVPGIICTIFPGTGYVFYQFLSIFSAAGLLPDATLFTGLLVPDPLVWFGRS